MSDVLVVEDDDDLAELLVMMLEQAGHRTRRASDGREGLRALGERLPDVVLLDVEMPRMSGPDMAYRMFVEDAGKEHVPVVLLSAVVGLADVATTVGTPYFLGKPCDTSALAQTLERAMRERRAPVPVRRALG